jgi:hypothetical protein
MLIENLRNWFSKTHPDGNWVRMDTKGNIKGDCAREPGEGKPKCLPLSKARSMSKADRASAVRRKRRNDPVADRPGKGGAPVMVNTESNITFSNLREGLLIEKNEPTNPELWSRAKSLARSKFDVYPSAYANGWAAKWYKKRGGSWRIKEDACCTECGDMNGITEEIFESLGNELYEDWGEIEEENEGKKLNKPFLTPGGPKKRSVYVKNEKGNVVKVNFGDPNMTIKRDDPERRKSFRARHGCDNPGPKTKANYWSCKFWSSTPVSKI